MDKKRKTPRGWQPNIFFSSFFGPAGGANLSRSRKSGRPVAAARPHPKKHATPSTVEPKPKCPCKAFTNADKYWQENQEELRPIWNAAVKRQWMSGYELFMKEALTLCPITGTLPLCPSVSGGFTTHHLQPGKIEVPPAGEWIGKAPPPVTAGDPCEYCAGDTPKIVPILVAGFTGWAAQFNGPRDLEQHGDMPCTWGKMSETYQIFLDRHPFQTWVAVIYDVGTGDSCEFIKLEAPLDCCANTLLTVDRMGFAFEFQDTATIELSP